MHIRLVSLLVIAAGLALATRGAAEEVTCTATKAVVCANLAGGCKDDRVYTIKFTVNRASGTIADTDGNIYKILPTESLPPLFEYAIQASGQVGTAATETIVLGQKSFVSSNVSVAPPRAYVQIGACSGLVTP